MTAQTTSGGTWYGMYQKCKDFSGSGTTDIMQSSMIWGSQYDAMLNWILTGTDKGKVRVNRNGNHSGSKVNTGTTTTDKMNNIYDLEGNLFEWTAEAIYTYGRVSRGGNYNFSDPASYRGYYNPYNTVSRYSSRVTLYIK